MRFDFGRFGLASHFLMACSCVLVFACGNESNADDPDTESGEQCEEGDEGCTCYGNGTCNGELTCYSNLCVDATALSDGGATADESEPTRPGPSDSENEPGSDEPGATGTDGGASGPNEPTQTEPMPSPEPGPDEPNPDPEQTPVARHGQLSVSGTSLVDEHGVATQLKGISSMWLNWEPTGFAESLEGLRWMRDNWNLQLIRAAMGVKEQPGDGAYLEDPEKAKEQVRRIVDNAIELGVYVLIDWHDHHAHENQAEAEAFFAEMAQAYGDVPNVLYEVYNEPLDVDWTNVLVPYHTAVTSVIRQHDPDNVIVLGTPNWSQDVDIAAYNPVEGTNLMYTLHFYACDHTDFLRSKAETALANGLPLFVTEWGATPADGGAEIPTVCESEATAWHDWLDREKISWAAWKLDGCADSSCLFVDRNVPVDGGWTDEMLNGHAPFVISRLRRVSEPEPGEPDPTGGGDCVAAGSCASGDRLDCVDGELAEGDCSGCSLLLTCTDCCEGLGYLGARSVTSAFTLDTSLVTSFAQSETSATVEMSFTAADQMAAISFALDGTAYVDPYYLRVDLDASADFFGGQLSVTLENGSAGCQYLIVEGSPAVYPLPLSCWEDFTPSSPVAQINVRMDSPSYGNAALTVYGISW